MVTAGHRPESGSLNSKGRGPSGTPSGSDPTNEPGQYPPGSFFGISVPSGTGAPGTGGGMGSGNDPTTEAGQLQGNFGTPGGPITNTGAPGSQGAPADPADGGQAITYTRPGSYLTGTYQSATSMDEIGGPQDSTQANDVGYGTSGPQLPALKGNQPTSTGAGQGSVMRGGRSVR